MLRSITPCARVAMLASSSLTAATRTVWTTAQAPQLATVKAERGYEHDLWIGVQDDMWWARRETDVKYGQDGQAVSVTLPKRMELFNASQLKFPIDDPEPAEHSSFSTKKQYKGGLHQELQQRAVINDYASKWWLTPNQVRQRGYQIAHRQRPHAVLLHVRVPVLNVAEFEDPNSLLRVPINGDNGRPVYSDMRDTLEATMSERGLTSSIFFTEGFVSETGEALALQDGAASIDVMSTDVFTYYNIEEFESSDALASLKPEGYSANAEAPQYLTTGSPITMKHVASALTGSGFTESLWMSHKDLQFKEKQDPEKFKLKPGAAGVTVPAFASSWYSLDDMQDVQKAMKVVGTHTR